VRSRYQRRVQQLMVRGGMEIGPHQSCDRPANQEQRIFEQELSYLVKAIVRF